MTSHVDTETLALLAEGLLEGDEEDSVQAHVGECERCADELTALADVSRVLAEVPATPLPDAVVARIDDALRAEAENRGAAAPPDEAAPPAQDIAPVVPLRRRSGPTRWLPYLAAAAAAVFVIGGGTAVLREVMTPDSANAPLSAPQPGSSTGPDAALAYYPIVVSTGTDYTAATLADQGGVLIQRAGVQGAADESGTGGAPGTDPLPSPTALPSDLSACVHRIDVDGQQRPKVIDLASYEGAPAWIMVFGTPPDGTGTPHEYTVRVVAPECGTAGGADDAVLAEATVPVS
ncbi:hypothetical protein [Marinactinospora rubrisoli]|uniref:Zinc-finger domain-containing protein n=1 Tax=Marinactinospora rubrisoli TaxID=2715399 RepID=A0ABW2KFA1_9ACTN